MLTLLLRYVFYICHAFRSTFFMYFHKNFPLFFMYYSKSTAQKNEQSLLSFPFDADTGTDSPVIYHHRCIQVERSYANILKYNYFII